VPDAPDDPSPAGWEQVLGGLLAWGDAPAPAPRSRRAALQLELRELTPHTRERWNGPVSRTATARRPGEDPGGAVRLGARPVLRSDKGWTRGNVTWTNIPHMQARLDLDPEQHRWFCQVGALHRAAGPPLPGADAAWVYLDEFVNPVLWDLLRQARELGIPLVGSGANADVRVADAAWLGLDVVRQAGDVRAGEVRAGDVRVSAHLTLDGVPAPVAHAHPIGTHGLYVVDPAHPRRVVLAPTTEPLGPQQLALLDGAGGRTVADALRTGVVVPAADAETFVREHLPALRVGLDVASADGTVALPPPAPPTLVLTVRYAPGHAVDLSWRWDGHARSGPAPDPRHLVPGDLLPGGWPAPDEADLPGPVTLRDADAAEFVLTALPRIAARRGVRVDTVGTAPDYRLLQGTPVLSVTAQPSEKTDWFDLGVTVTIDGRVIPFGPLFTALAQGRRRMRLVDHTYLRLDHPALEPLAALVAEARELAEWETGLRISRHQTTLWADLAELADEATPPDAWRELLAEAAGDAPRPVPLPRGLRAELRPYQAEGFAWLAFLWRHRLGGVLADDMGLGKTLQCLALLQHVAEERPADEPRRPFLVVAPTSVTPNWVAEAARFTPGLTVRRMTGTEAAGGPTVAEQADGADVVVTSYALLRLDAAAYQAQAWAGLVLDEAQQVKNPSAQVHRAARDLDVPFALALTGTPVENSLTDLHALLALVTPGLLPPAAAFGLQYVRPIEDAHAGITDGAGAGDVPESTARLRAARLARLRRRVRPFLLRRTKDLVAADLPEKQEQTLTVELTPAHRDIYDLYLQRERQKLLGLIEDLDRQRFIVYRSLTLLRMLALDASLIDPEHAGIPSAKLDALVEQLEDVAAEGHRALVFSQFTSYLAKAAARLDAAGIPYVYLDGSTNRRDEVVEQFRDGDAPVFLISLKAGGVGLNLTEADYVFLLDPWWNPAAEQQAVDRAHRIGQDKPVMVYRLIAAGTIEEKVVALQARKAALVDAVLDDGDLFSTALTADDLRGLLD
jgi:superfamily II DNA or RNA helicase